MTEAQLTRLLQRAAASAEASAPPVDPLSALAGTRRRHEQRRGHLVALVFVTFAVLVQLAPAEAFGASGPAPAATVVAQRHGAVLDQVAGG